MQFSRGSFKGSIFSLDCKLDFFLAFDQDFQGVKKFLDDSKTPLTNEKAIIKWWDVK